MAKTQTTEANAAAFTKAQLVASQMPTGGT